MTVDVDVDLDGVAEYVELADNKELQKIISWCEARLQGKSFDPYQKDDDIRDATYYGEFFVQTLWKERGPDKKVCEKLIEVLSEIAEGKRPL